MKMGGRLPDVSGSFIGLGMVKSGKIEQVMQVEV